MTKSLDRSADSLFLNLLCPAEVECNHRGRVNSDIRRNNSQGFVAVEKFSRYSASHETDLWRDRAAPPI